MLKARRWCLLLCVIPSVSFLKVCYKWSAKCVHAFIRILIGTVLWYWGLVLLMYCTKPHSNGIYLPEGNVLRKGLLTILSLLLKIIRQKYSQVFILNYLTKSIFSMIFEANKQVFSKPLLQKIYWKSNVFNIMKNYFEEIIGRYILFYTVNKDALVTY